MNAVSEFNFNIESIKKDAAAGDKFAVEIIKWMDELGKFPSDPGIRMMLRCAKADYAESRK